VTISFYFRLHFAEIFLFKRKETFSVDHGLNFSPEIRRQGDLLVSDTFWPSGRFSFYPIIPNMKYIFTTFLSTAFLLISTLSLSGQEIVWPGDANASGSVNGIDLLYWGQAFGEKGEKRGNSSGNWTDQILESSWESSFPDGVNLSHADANGDGRVSTADVSIIAGNLHLTRFPAPNTDRYAMPDTSGEHKATLRLLPAGVKLTPSGSVLLLDVSMTGRDTVVENFYGLSFNASFTPGLLADHLKFAKARELKQNLANGIPYISLIEVDSTAHQLRFSITAIDHEDREVDGAVSRISVPLAANIDPDRVATAMIIIDSLVVYDKSAGTYPVATDTTSLSTDNGCSYTVSPVCGADGVTYLNGCFAEAAGVLTYTAGACWNPGIVVANMNPDAGCPTAYEPVCGFNGVTYANACAAEAAGVVNYSTGLCSAGDLTCYDPSLIVISSGTSLNQASGILTLVCAGGSDAVCGCDGERYASACLAEASGVRSYTRGGCDNSCIDPTQIANTEYCGTATEFVCGCNGETYINACYADAAGVLNYSPGPCNGTSGWCDEATVINCGDYLPYETTIGAGNQISSYPGATGALMRGPDRVYVFEKTSAGDLQVGLEITTPGLNMDIFLLTGDCGNYNVVGHSTTSNSQTNNEGIVLEDAPNGTYYIVVDQAAAGVGGDYRLELSCGYLDCSERVPLSCGVTYNGTNAGGNDDVSTYTCGPTLNVENNGPEVIHTFTTTSAGLVTIDLTGLTSNLELFLLSECSRRSCLQFSQHPGTASEQIVRNLPAGTYYVVVDGYNASVSDYSLTVDCASACNLNIGSVSQTGTGCGQSGGSYSFRVSGGTPTYSAHYVGPVCRAAVSHDGRFTFSHLPPGDYTTTVEDGNGCHVVFPFTIGSGSSSLAGTATPTAAGCGQEGSIEVGLTTAGSAPYTVYLSGDLTRTFSTRSINFVITPLAAGNYTVAVVDAGGCSFTRHVSVGTSSGNLDVTARAEPAGCDGTPGQIVVQAPDGVLPYQVHVSGPVTGGATVNGYNFRVRTLPAGQYTFTLTDAFGCSYTEILTVEGGALETTVSATPANCSLPGAARVNISSGTAPYTINYSGPVSGTLNNADQITVINNLPGGTYNFSIWAADGCDQSTTVFIDDNGGNLDLNVVQIASACDGNNSSIQLLLNGGTPNYTVTYSGPVSGSTTVDGTGTGLIDLPAGTYTFTATDFGACSATTEITVNGGLSGANQSSFAYGAGCGQLDNIRTLLSLGEAPFEVTVTSDACPSTNTNFTSTNPIFELTDLPNCTYIIQVIDANGCSTSRTVTIDVDPDADFLTLSTRDGSCGGLGAIDLAISAGEGPYFINWTGPVSDSVNLLAQSYRARDLPAGTYTFNLTNAAGCESTRSITLLNDGTLEVVSSVVADDCGRPDQIWNDIEGGTGPYVVEVVRLCDNQVVSVDVSGAGFEIVDLIPCDYKIKVTDANGCMTMRTVTVDPYQLFNIIVTDGSCDQTGSIEVMVMNSNAVGPYTITYSGPASGTIADADGLLTLNDLPGGTYTILVTDVNGCTETETATVAEITTDLELQTALINNDCGQYNQLWNDINGGVAPYNVEVVRICDGVVETTFNLSENGFELTNLSECCYRVTITDALGCTIATETCVEDSSADLFTATPLGGPCGQSGRIDLAFTRGTGPYQVSYTGPQNGNNTVNGNQLSIGDAPAGNYIIMVTDANGCIETETTTVEATTSDLVLNAALINNDCGQYNQVWIDILNGTGPFSIEVIRQCDGTTLMDFVSGDVGFELTDLDPCEYKIIVTDAAGCMQMSTITVSPGAIDIFDLTSVSGGCNEPGSFNLDITRGRAPYLIQISGPVSESITTDATDLSRTNLPDGNYTVTVTDSIGCVETDQFTIQSTNSDLDVVTSLIFNDCGQLNQLWSDINGGTGPFNVTVTRLCDNTPDTTFTTDLRLFELVNRTPCDYKIVVTDASGCMDMETIRVQNTSADLVDLTVNNSCDSSGFNIAFISGSAPFRIVISGPMIMQMVDVMDDVYIPAPAGDYSLRIFSAEGCTEMNFVTIEADQAGELPDVGFNSSVSGLSATFTNSSAPGSYVWDFGDGSATSTDTDPVHVYASSGTYEVCLTVVGDCGDNQVCQALTVGSTGDAQIVIGGARSFSGNSVRVPVSLHGLNSISSIAGTFALDDPGIATITHVSAAAVDPEFNPADNSFSFVADDTDGMEMVNEEINVLFYLHLTLDNPGSAEITLVDTPVSLEISTVRGGVSLLVPATYQPGFINSEVSLLGHISTQARSTDNQLIDNTLYQLSEPNGNYIIDLPQDAEGIASTLSGLSLGRMYYVKPVKTTDYANGLSSVDIFLARRYMLGYNDPEINDPMQVVAMDMNCNDALSIIDQLIMQRLLIGDDLDEVPDCNSWTFIPDTHEFADDWRSTGVFPAPRRAEVVLRNDTMVMFTAVKTGDVTGGADPGRSQGELPLLAELPEVLNAGDIYRVGLTLTEAADLVAFQGELVVADGLEIVSATASDLPTMSISSHLNERGLLRMSWFSDNGEVKALHAGATVVKLTVRATVTQRIDGELFTFNNDTDLRPEAHDENLRGYRPTVYTSATTATSPVFRLVGAAPNPAADFTDVRFELPAVTQVEMVLIDALGRVVIRREQTLEAGPQRFRLDTRALAGGAYSFRVRAGEAVGTGKLIVRR